MKCTPNWGAQTGRQTRGRVLACPREVALGVDKASWDDSGPLGQLWGLHVKSRGGTNLVGKMMHLAFYMSDLRFFSTSGGEKPIGWNRWLQSSGETRDGDRMRVSAAGEGRWELWPGGNSREKKPSERGGEGQEPSPGKSTFRVQDRKEERANEIRATLGPGSQGG